MKCKIEKKNARQRKGTHGKTAVFTARLKNRAGAQERGGHGLRPYQICCLYFTQRPIRSFTKKQASDSSPWVFRCFVFLFFFPTALAGTEKFLRSIRRSPRCAVAQEMLSDLLRAEANLTSKVPEVCRYQIQLGRKKRQKNMLICEQGRSFCLVVRQRCWGESASGSSNCFMSGKYGWFCIFLQPITRMRSISINEICATLERRLIFFCYQCFPKFFVGLNRYAKSGFHVVLPLRRALR